MANATPPDHESEDASDPSLSEPLEGDPRPYGLALYWRANLRLLGVLLAVWFLVSFGFGILLVEPLNAIPFFGFKLGFWWAQQGAIYVFVVLIFVYVALMRRIDRKYGVGDLDDDDGGGA